MAATGKATGNITIGEPASPDISIALAALTGTITAKVQGDFNSTTTGTVTIPMGGVSAAQLVWIKITNASTGNPVRCNIKMSDATSTTGVTIDETNEHLRTCYGSTTGVTAVAVTAPDATEVKIEYAMAGT